MPKKRPRTKKREVLDPDQLEYLRTGDDLVSVGVFVWAHPANREKIQAAYESIREQHPAGAFPWAEKEYGGKR